MPCKIAAVSPLDQMMNFLVPVAYAGDCIPGSAENAIKDILNAATSNEIPGDKVGEYIARQKDARITKGNFDLPSDTIKESEFLGEARVGSNARKVPYEGQTGIFISVSVDEMKQFRPAVIKSDGRGVANFQWIDPVTGKWIGNGHMTVKD